MSRFYQPDLGGRLDGFAQEYRLRIWQDSLPLLAEYPVGGVGLAAYPATIPPVSRLDLPADPRLAHPDSSWVLIAEAEQPDSLLALGAQPGFPASRLLQTWIERGAPGSLANPNLAAFCFAAIDRAPDAGTLLAQLLPQRAAELPAAVTLAAARRLHAAGGSDRAWTTLIRIEPVRSLDEERESLRADPRYRQWVQLLDENESLRPGDHTGRMRLLNEIIGQAGAAPWFRREKAKLLHLLGQDREAVDGVPGLFPDMT